MNRIFVVMRARAGVRYPVAAFTEEDRAQIYSDWCSRSVPLADHSVVAVPLDPHLTRTQAAFMEAKPARIVNVASVCGRGYARPMDCDSSLCRERGCHNPMTIVEREKNPAAG